MTNKTLDIKKYYDISKSIDAQDRLVVKNRLPRYVSFDGECYRCKRNVYDVHYWKIRSGIKQEVRAELGEIASGVSIRRASEELIVVCPHCYMSFKDIKH